MATSQPPPASHGPTNTTTNPQTQDTTTHPETSPSRPSIAVLGAGLSSLRLTHLLLSSHPQPHIKVFEARSRPGGRLHQALCGGHVVDMGPNWIHGTDGNPILDLAEKTGTVVTEPPELNDIFDGDGKRLGRGEAEFVSGEVWREVSGAMGRSREARDARRRGGDGGSGGCGEVSTKLGLGEVLSVALTERARSGEGRWGQGSKAERDKRLKNAIEETRMWGPFIGEAVERQSYKFFYMEECVDGGNLFVADTYEKILEEVTRPVLAAGVVSFDSEVVKVQMLEGDRGVKVGLRSGDEEIFDEVVCTAPLGWLKRNEKAVFEPRLPKSTRAAIDGLGYGRLEKIYVTFPEAWWMNGAKHGSSDKDGHNDARSTNGTIHLTDKADDPARPLGIFAHIFAPSSTLPSSSSTANPPSSNLNLVSLTHLPGATAHPTLLAYLYGDTSTALVTSLRGLADHSPQYRATLWRFLEPYLRVLPGYTAGSTECTPVQNGILSTRWQEDEFAGGGSYSCFLTGDDGQGDLEEMVAALRDGGGLSKERDYLRGDAAGGIATENNSREPRRGGIWFAGEHVSPLEGLGTTTGAWWSGEAVAERLAGKWGFEVSKGS